MGLQKIHSYSGWFLPNDCTTAKVLKQLDLFWPKCLLKDAKALSDVAKHLYLANDAWFPVHR